MPHAADTSRTGQRAKGRLPVAAIVAACVLLAMEGAFLAVSEPMSGWPVFEPTADDATVIAKRQMMEHCRGAVALVGDSSCLMGMRPGVIAEATGQSVVNLGTLSSFTLAGYAMQVRELMAMPEPPRAVVLVVLPQAMSVTAQQAQAFGLPARYQIAHGHEAVGVPPGLTDWRDWWFRKHRVNQFPAAFGGSFATYRARLSATRGFIEERKLYEGARRRMTDFTVTPFARTALRDMARSTRQRGVPLYLWWSPKPEDAVTPGYADRVRDLTRTLAAADDGPRPLQQGMPLWPAPRFGSINHLRPEAATEQSGRFAARLIDPPGSPQPRLAVTPAP